MSNDAMPAPTKIPATIGAQAAGALAVGAIAVGALAIGALAIGRLMIGRARIRRLEIDELVVGRLYARENMTAPSAPMTDENRPKKQSARLIDRQYLIALSTNFLDFLWASD